MEWWNEPAVIEALGLDEVTRQAIDEEVYRSQQEMITLRAEAERQGLDLQRVLRTQPADVDLGAVEDQVDRVVQARGAVMKEEILLRARIMALLTPEQRTQLEDRFQARRQRFRDRTPQDRNRRPDPMDPPPGPEEPR
jgi:Spy/CpxP family protein refolding chaperone